MEKEEEKDREKEEQMEKEEEKREGVRGADGKGRGEKLREKNL
jgi:hypothetical protein